jgi:GLPGLI family protein
MKKICAIVMAAAVCVCAFAGKKIDECLYKFVYQCQIRTTEEVVVPEAETYVLEVGKKLTKFYPPRFEQSAALKDSILSVGMTYEELLTLLMTRNLFDVSQSMRIINNYPTHGEVTEIGNMGDDYVCSEKAEKQDWQFVPGDTIIAGHKCACAKTSFRGRNWIAWYAVDLPIHSGPWKLNGLPGLILYAKDADGYFVFDCVQMRQDASADIEYVTKSINRKCTTAEFYKLKKQWLSNSYGLMLQVAGVSADEMPRDIKKKTPILLEIDGR